MTLAGRIVDLADRKFARETEFPAALGFAVDAHAAPSSEVEGMRRVVLTAPKPPPKVPRRH